MTTYPFDEGIAWIWDHAKGRWILRVLSLIAVLVLTGCGGNPRCTPSETPVTKASETHLCPGGICK
jgi:hypothetical protein